MTLQRIFGYVFNFKRLAVARGGSHEGETKINAEISALIQGHAIRAAISFHSLCRLQIVRTSPHQLAASSGHHTPISRLLRSSFSTVDRYLWPTGLQLS